MRRVVLTVLLAACGAVGGTGSSGPRATTGSIVGLARDQDSGDPVAKAEIRLRADGSFKPLATVSGDQGTYELGKLAPGKYSLSATFAGQPIEVNNIMVRPGATTNVDLTFTLGRPEPITIDHVAYVQGNEIDRYKPTNLASSAVALIEGTVVDTQTRQRVSGAVVTAIHDNNIASTQQTVSDDHGRYRFESMPPGVYSISAYYSVSGRAQIEVRRSGIDVAKSEAVVVPLWIEMNR